MPDNALLLTGALLSDHSPPSLGCVPLLLLDLVLSRLPNVVAHLVAKLSLLELASFDRLVRMVLLLAELSDAWPYVRWHVGPGMVIRWGQEGEPTEPGT